MHAHARVTGSRGACVLTPPLPSLPPRHTVPPALCLPPSLPPGHLPALLLAPLAATPPGLDRPPLQEASSQPPCRLQPPRSPSADCLSHAAPRSPLPTPLRPLDVYTVTWEYGNTERHKTVSLLKYRDASSAARDKPLTRPGCSPAAAAATAGGGASENAEKTSVDIPPAIPCTKSEENRMESVEGRSMRANMRVHVFLHDARTQGFGAIGVRARLWFCGARVLLAPSRRRKRTRHRHPPRPPLSVPRRQHLYYPEGASAPSARGASRPSPPALRRRRATRGGAAHARAPRAPSAPQLGQGNGESRPAQ